MQFKNILTFALYGATLASAAAPVRRQEKGLDIIKGGLSSIQAKLQDLDAAVKALAAGADVAKATADIVSKSTIVEDAIKAAITKISAAPVVTILEAIQVQSASTTLSNLTKATVDDLIAKKDVIAAAGQLKTTQQQLASQKASADLLAAAIISKLPDAVKSVAQLLSKSIAENLDRGAKAFI
jgi:hypothetical protein